MKEEERKRLRTDVSRDFYEAGKVLVGAKAREEKLEAEIDLLKDYIDNIASIIYYQMSLKEQDLWVEDVVAMGLYKYPNDGEDEDGSKL